MTALNETLHAGGFIVTEANGFRSRGVCTVLTGLTLKAGQVVQDNGAGKKVAFTGLVDSNGDVITQAAGILFDAVDSTGGDVAGAVIVDNDAEVRLADLTYPAETTAGGEEAATIASLALLGIKTR